MITHDELLAVARLVGFEHPMVFDEDDGQGPYVRYAKRAYWRPLTDDGDSRRLEVDLYMTVTHVMQEGFVNAYAEGASCGKAAYFDECGGDRRAVTRLVVFAAALQLAKDRNS